MLQVSQSQAVPDRPPCWGRSFNNEDQGCLACMFRISCRDEIIRLSRSAAPVTPQSQYFNFYGQPAQPNQFYRSPAVVNAQPRPFMSSVPQPIAPITPARQPIVGQPHQAMAQVQHQLPYSQIGWYGSIPDTMWGAVASVPPIFRPQMQGETFLLRLAKNTALVLGEIICRELMLAFRQATLPPAPPMPPPAAEQVVDVSPQS